MRLAGVVALVIGALVFGGCSSASVPQSPSVSQSPAVPESPSVPQSPPVPQYRVVKTEDVSMGDVTRLQLRVSVPRHYSEEQVRQVAEAIVKDTTTGQDVNAIGIFFYGPGVATDGAYDVASVNWAPNGRWEDAGSVQAGDYSSFGYDISYQAPTPASRPSSRARLKPSGKRGLLGAPLPAGARLTERRKGDPAAGVDPAETYSIRASAADIAAFFYKVMPSAGWARGGASTDTSLIFQKGKHMLGVIIDSGGKSFMLMGS
jgi:hypothetical protein